MNLYSKIPSVDLHGMDREIAILTVKEFIEDCIKLKYQEIMIIHGIGSGILRKSVNNYLKTNKHVLQYKLDFMNPGCTIVTLNITTLTK